MAAPAELARRLFHDYYIPRIGDRRAGISRVRVAFVTIQVVNPSTSQPGTAECVTEDGDTVIWPYGEITPSTGLRWRALMIGRGGWFLDDYARNMST